MYSRRLTRYRPDRSENGANDTRRTEKNEKTLKRQDCGGKFKKKTYKTFVVNVSMAAERFMIRYEMLF